MQSLVYHPKYHNITTGMCTVYANYIINNKETKILKEGIRKSEPFSRFDCGRLKTILGKKHFFGIKNSKRQQPIRFCGISAQATGKQFLFVIELSEKQTDGEIAYWVPCLGVTSNEEFKLITKYMYLSIVEFLNPKSTYSKDDIALIRWLENDIGEVCICFIGCVFYNIIYFIG